MAQHDSRPSRESDSLAFPGIETFRFAHKWYYWYCFPGCMPESEPVGPFDTEEDALAEARENADDEGTETDRCDSCEAVMINGLYCHETGCPNTRRHDRDDSEDE